MGQTQQYSTECSATYIYCLSKVVFVREDAADTGGPTREFWRLITEGRREKFCTGEEGKMVFERNTPALQNILECQS